jgi:hypothetical protein
MYLKFLLWCVWCVGGAWLICGLMGWTGCVSEVDERQHWQGCGAVMHEVCREKGNLSDRRECEYEYYKECVNAKPTP